MSFGTNSATDTVAVTTFKRSSFKTDKKKKPYVMILNKDNILNGEYSITTDDTSEISMVTIVFMDFYCCLIMKHLKKNDKN